MRKGMIVLLFLLFSTSAQAQTAKLTGSWLMTKVDAEGKTRHPYQIFDFMKDGKFIGMGMELGTWKYEKKGNKIIMESKMDKDFNGSSKVLKLTAEELNIEKDGAKYFCRRMHPEKIASTNKTSKLAGNWKLAGTDYPTAFLKFELPQDFTLIQSGNGETDKASGTWMFMPEENAVIFIGFSHLLRGKIVLNDVSADSFTLKLSDRTLKARRLKADATKIERLTFKEEDFPEDVQPDDSKLPWRDFDKMVQVLKNVASLKYTYGELVEEFNTLKYTSSILSTLNVDPMKPSVKFTNLYIVDGDTSQFSENYKGGLMGRYNAFFPKDEPWPYRIKGVEKVSVPAGTFDCTVIEAVDGKKKSKYWMINDMPGIYARIIREGTDPFGKTDYSVQELEKINYLNK